MGIRLGPYQPDFPVGTYVRIADVELLRAFQCGWRYHNPLTAEQLPYAGRTVMVESVGFYHGGDELYRLVGIPGVWHASCLALAT